MKPIHTQTKQNNKKIISGCLYTSKFCHFYISKPNSCSHENKLIIPFSLIDLFAFHSLLYDLLFNNEFYKLFNFHNLYKPGGG